MSKTTAPLLSFGASGQLGKSMVYSSWRGISYTRKYVKPSNPDSAGQQKVRTVFAWSSGTWKIATTLLTQTWTAFAKGKQFTDRNAFIGQNTKAMQGDTTLADIVWSPGANGGIPPVSMTATGGAGEITVHTVNPSLPAGWVLTGMVALATIQGNPQTLGSSEITAGQDSGTFDNVALTGLAAGTYEVGAYLIFNKGSGPLAYSTALTATATVT